MNVNPFSYLIEKLKSKVSKTGDTMTGDLTVDTGTSTDSVVVIGGSQNYGALRLKAGTTGKQGTIITAALTANRNYILPDNGGTVALTSDLYGTYYHSGLTYTNSSYSIGGYAKIGNLVILNLRIAVSVTDATVKPYVTLPNNIKPSFSGSLALLAVNSSDDEPPIYCVISGGDIYLKNVVSGKNYTISGTWIAQ